jgi:syntaxin 5
MQDCDRTLEFFHLLERQQQSGRVASLPPPAKRVATTASRDLDDFHRTSATVRAVVAGATSKLERLSVLVERTRSLHGAGSAGINQLTLSVTSDMAQASEAVQTLNKVVGHITQPGTQLHDHCRHVVGILDDKLRMLSRQCKTTLQRQQQHLRKSSARREIFGSEFAALETPLGFGVAPGGNSGGAATVAVGAGRSGGRSSGNNGRASLSSSNAGEGDGSVDIDLTAPHDQQQQALIAEQNYYQERSQAMTNVERSIVDVSQLFGQLGDLINEQGETISTIENNIEDAIANSDAAVDNLSDAWKNTQGNKMLFLKIFLILMAFLFFFIVFLA